MLTEILSNLVGKQCVTNDHWNYFGEEYMQDWAKKKDKRTIVAVYQGQCSTVVLMVQDSEGILYQDVSTRDVKILDD